MQLISNDLASGLSILALALLIGGLIAAFSIARARRHGSTTLALDVMRNASYGWTALMGVGAIAAVFTVLLRDEVSLDPAVLGWVRAQEDLLRSPACDVPTGNVPDGFEACGSTIAGVGFGARVVMYLAAVLMLTAFGMISFAIYNATRRAGERTPFHPTVFRVFGVAAIVVMVTAVTGGILQGIGMTLAARSLDWAPGADIPFELSIPLWPFAVGGGFFALSAIFRYGAQLQRETEGLV